MIHICNVQAINYVEYINKFNGIQRMLMDFTVTMLDCCKDMDEAELLLKTDIKLYKDSQMTLHYPRIHIAIVNKDSDFVSHDFCQVSDSSKKMYHPFQAILRHLGNKFSVKNVGHQNIFTNFSNTENCMDFLKKK